MAVLYLSVGISGSGKSTYIEKNMTNIPVVCPDDIRRELTGNISDQTHNKEVWEIAYNRIEELLSTGHNVVLSATNLSLNNIKTVIINTNPEHIIFLIFEDSLDWEKCRDRVLHDLYTNKDRSNTDIIVKGKHLIQIMSERYSEIRKIILDHLDKKKECNVFEKVSTFLFIKEGKIVNIRS